MQIANLLHAEPAKFRSTNSTHHVITRAIVHFDNEYLAPRTGFNVIAAVLWILTNAAGCGTHRTLPRGASCIAGLVWMPFSLTVITKIQITAGTFTLYPWTRSTSCRNYSIAKENHSLVITLTVLPKNIPGHWSFIIHNSQYYASPKRKKKRRENYLPAVRCRTPSRVWIAQ